MDITGETPTLIDPQLVRDVDLVVTLGSEAKVDRSTAPTSRTGTPTSRPNEASTESNECGLVRDDIAARVDALAAVWRPADTGSVAAPSKTREVRKRHITMSTIEYSNLHCAATPASAATTSTKR